MSNNNEDSLPPYETSHRTIYGNLVADPENQSRNGGYFVPLRVANNNRSWRGVEGEFFTTVLVTKDTVAQNVLLTLKKGMPVIVEGRESVEEYEGNQRLTILVDKRGGHISLDLNRSAVLEDGVSWGKPLVDYRNDHFESSDQNSGESRPSSGGASRPSGRPAARPGTSGGGGVSAQRPRPGGSGTATARPRPGGATARPAVKTRSN